MRFVSLGYVKSKEFNDPTSWLNRIKPYVQVLEALAKNHSVASIEQIDYEGYHESNGVKYYFIQVKNRRRPTRLHRLVKNLQPDVVIVHGMGHPLQVLQLRTSLGKNVRVLVQSHADRITPGWKKWLQKLADRSIDAYLFTSAEIAAPWIKRGIIADWKKVKEVMMGASIFQEMNRDAAQSITKMKGSPVFLYVGRVDSNKDPFTLIHGFSLFARLHPSASLYLILQHSENVKEIQNLIDTQSMGQNIFIVGVLPHPQMQAWFGSADFIVSTSHAEAFGMAVSEAMGCGCYPVVSNIPAFVKLTSNGRYGILFQPGNAEQLAASLENACMLDLEMERKNLRQYYHQHLSADAIAKQLEAAAQSIEKKQPTK